MFVLSPLVTAARASAPMAPGPLEVVPVEPGADDPAALPLGRADGGRPWPLRSTIETVWPSAVSDRARPEPDPAATDHDDVHDRQCNTRPVGL